MVRRNVGPLAPSSLQSLYCYTHLFLLCPPCPIKGHRVGPRQQSGILFQKHKDCQKGMEWPAQVSTISGLMLLGTLAV